MGAPRDDLRLLSIFHYVLAGLAAPFSLVGLLYAWLGMSFTSGNFGEGAPPPLAFGWIFVAVGLGLTVAGLAYATLLALAGRFLARRRAWTFCVVMAALSCTFFPLGTALGVFTLVTLTRPEVKALFAAPAA